MHLLQRCSRGSSVRSSSCCEVLELRRSVLSSCESQSVRIDPTMIVRIWQTFRFAGLCSRCLRPACHRPELHLCRPAAPGVQHATATTHAAPRPSDCRSSCYICGTREVERWAALGLSHRCASLKPPWKQRTWSRWGICSPCRGEGVGGRRFGGKSVNGGVIEVSLGDPVLDEQQTRNDDETGICRYPIGVQTTRRAATPSLRSALHVGICDSLYPSSESTLCSTEQADRQPLEPIRGDNT